MKKKILVSFLILVLVGGAFVTGRQVGLNTEKSKTQTIITEEVAKAQNIQKTLTSSGFVATKETTKLELDTSKYFEAMCVEEGDMVSKGENILKYTDDTYLTAPYDLVISSVNVPSTKSKCTSSNYIELSNLTTLQTTISVSESQIGSIAKGQDVEITLTADEEKTYTGKVTKIDEIGNYSASGTTFSVVIEFENNGNIKLGMSLSCTIILEEAKEVICVPIEAVSEDNGEEYVNKINEDESVVKTVVETGIADDSYVQILSGLNENDKVQIVTEITESSSDSSNNSQSNMGGFGKDMQSMTDFGGEMPDMQGERPEMPTGKDMPNRDN